MRRFALLLSSLVLAAGCSRGTASTASAAPPEADATPVAVVHDAGAKDAATASVFEEGEHAYDGKLGVNTNIAMRITRSGRDVRGTYTYLSIGRPIAIEGKVESTGELVLNEKTNGKISGTLRLKPSGKELVGQWSDPPGKKVFPVRVSSAAINSDISLQLARCLEDLDCPASDVVGLAIAADDAHEPASDCFRFLEGDVVPRDVVRARACFERGIGPPCDGSSAFLDREALAVMLIDGVGGKSDIPGAKALFSTCLDDVTKDEVLKYAAAGPHSPSVDACKIGGTTLVWNQCVGHSEWRAREVGFISAKKIATTLDNEGRRLFLAVNKAHEEYADARARFILDIYAGGSLGPPLAGEHKGQLIKKRADDLEAFASFDAKSPTEAEANAAIKAAKCENTEKEYKAYRDAEVAFYDHVYGGAQGHAEVRRAIIIKLSKRRATECGEG